MGRESSGSRGAAEGQTSSLLFDFGDCRIAKVRWADSLLSRSGHQELDERASDAKRRVFQMSDDDDWTEHLKEEALTASRSKVSVYLSHSPVQPEGFC